MIVLIASDVFATIHNVVRCGPRMHKELCSVYGREINGNFGNNITSEKFKVIMDFSIVSVKIIILPI